MMSGIVRNERTPYFQAAFYPAFFFAFLVFPFSYRRRKRGGKACNRTYTAVLSRQTPRNGGREIRPDKKKPESVSHGYPQEKRRYGGGHTDRYSQPPYVRCRILPSGLPAPHHNPPAPGKPGIPVRARRCSVLPWPGYIYPGNPAPDPAAHLIRRRQWLQAWERNKRKPR